MNRALLYADWCCARNALRSSAKACALAIALAVSVSLLGGDAGVFDIDATSLVCSLCGMLAGFGVVIVVPRLFYADEQGGWGEFRLSLSAARSHAVASRFALVAALLASVAVAAQGLGILVVLATRLLPRVFGEWTLDAGLPPPMPTRCRCDACPRRGPDGHLLRGRSRAGEARDHDSRARGHARLPPCRAVRDRRWGRPTRRTGEGVTRGGWCSGHRRVRRHLSGLPRGIQEGIRQTGALGAGAGPAPFVISRDLRCQ